MIIIIAELGNRANFIANCAKAICVIIKRILSVLGPKQFRKKYIQILFLSKNHLLMAVADNAPVLLFVSQPIISFLIPKQNNALSSGHRTGTSQVTDEHYAMKQRINNYCCLISEQHSGNWFCSWVTHIFVG